jgi:D-glycero-D-manno-heptose 1,7-bisphosphate phosphatase
MRKKTKRKGRATGNRGTKVRCVFFDRDGIVNRHPGPGYVERWEDFHVLPEFVDILGTVRRLGYAAVIVTNQRGVALGRMTGETVEEMHRRLRRLLRDKHRLDVLDIFYCPHDRGVCECRKPKPGMLLEAARRHSIDLARSWMVGDSPSDVEAGRNAGCRTILVGDGQGAVEPDVRVADMKALRDAIAGLLSEPGSG